MKINLESLTVFESIARNGSYASAAKELFKVPSALTYTIGKLEDDLELKLFEKSGRNIKLTSVGEEFLKQSEQLLEHAKNVERIASQITLGWERELRIAINDIVPDDKILNLFKQFYQQTDLTHIRLSKEVLSGSWDALLSNRVDLIIGAPHYIPPAGFEVMPFCSLEFSFLVNKDHELSQQQTPITDEQIKHYRVSVVADTNRSLKGMDFDVYKDQKVLTFPNHQMKNLAQITGLCIGSSAKHLVKKEINDGTLVVKDITDSSLVGSHLTYCAYNKKHKGKALDWFIKQLKIISEEDNWLS